MNRIFQLKYRIAFVLFFLFFIGFFLFLLYRLDSPQIKLGLSYWIGYSFLYYLNDTNAFGKHFKTIEFNSTSEVIRAYRNKVVNSLCLTPDEVINHYRDEDPYTIIMAVAISNGADMIISRSDIKNPLEIKKIGLEDNALGNYILRRFLEINNINQSTVFVIHLEPQEHYKSFLSGMVDAIITYEPIASMILKEIGGNVIFSSKQISEQIYDFVLVRRDFLLENKKIIKELIDRYFKIFEEDFSNIDIYIDYMAKNYRVSKDIIQQILDKDSIKFLDRDANREILLSDELEKRLKTLEKYFFIEKQINYAKLIDKALIREFYD